MDNLKIGDICNYYLNNEYLTQLQSGERLFVVTDIEDGYIHLVPIGIQKNEYYDYRRVYSSIKLGEQYKKICFYSDIVICVNQQQISGKIGSINHELKDIIKGKSKNSQIVYDDYSDIVNYSDSKGIITIDDESLFAQILSEHAMWYERDANYLETDNHVILDTNTVLLNSPESGLMIPVMCGGERIFVVNIKFLQDDGEDVQIKMSTEGKLITLECLNFNDRFGRYTVNPIALGKINGKNVSVQIGSRIVGEDDTTRQVNYTIYWEK